MHSDSTGRRASDSCRGQTTLDFAIGISIFLGVVLFIFVFVPGILAPFTVGAQDETVAVNRVADGLAQGQLGSPERPNVVETACTVDFFRHAEDGTDITECGPPREDLRTFVGIKERQNVNVSIYGNESGADGGSDLLCWDRPNDRLVELDDGSPCTVPLTAGSRAPNANDDAVSAKRVVYLDGSDVTIRVEMW